MPSFDLSGISKTGAQKDYSFLVDSLSIKENQLSSDGKLSPGDYALLKKQAMEAYTHPGLSPDNRSKLLVKMSEYDRAAKVDSLKTSNDIGTLNNDMKDETYKQSLILGNNPVALSQARADALRAKLDVLSSSVESLDGAGDDSSAAVNEYNATLSDYNDALQAVDDIKAYGASPSGKPASSMIAYVTTNNKGQITDVQFGRVGAKSGYAETNGIYGGLQIYGKINRKQDGKNVFQIGNSTFSASDYTIPDPTNPGAFKSNPLVADDQKIAGAIQGSQAGQYKDIDTKTLTTQAFIPDGGFAKSSSGFIYQKMANGKYRKYANVADPSQIGVTDTNMINIPSSFEQNLLPNVTDTVDGSAQFAPPPPSGNTAPITSTSTPATPPVVPEATSTAPEGRPRTPAPIKSAGMTPGAVASDTQQSAGNFLSRLFGGK